MNSTNSTNSGRGFLKGINISAFLSCYQEWHALVEGFCEVLCPWPPKHEPSEELLTDLKGDHHYYMFGRALGVIAWLGIAKLIQEVFF
jgi:hypothetical protein